jgi:hypothetical protein
MARGGRRIGARRKKESLNRRSIDQVAASVIMPLDFMLKIVRDQTADLEMRLDMAKALAPYFHPKLAPVEYKSPRYDLSKLTDQEFEDLGRLVGRASN